MSPTQDSSRPDSAGRESAGRESPESDAAAHLDTPALMRTERLALVDFLQTCTPAQWSTPSLCTGWTVQDVAAHLAWAPVQPLLEAVVGMVRARFALNRLIADSAVRWSKRGTGAILEQLRANADSGAKPIGMPDHAALGDAVVHALDIRRPLELTRPVPEAAFVAAAEFFTGAGARLPLSLPIRGNTRRRISGLRLVCADHDWSDGAGPEVRGSAEAVLLVLTGRPVDPDELTGPGAEGLIARL